MELESRCCRTCGRSREPAGAARTGCCARRAGTLTAWWRRAPRARAPRARRPPWRSGSARRRWRAPAGGPPRAAWLAAARLLADVRCTWRLGLPALPRARAAAGGGAAGHARRRPRRASGGRRRWRACARGARAWSGGATACSPADAMTTTTAPEAGRGGARRGRAVAARWRRAKRGRCARSWTGGCGARGAALRVRATPAISPAPAAAGQLLDPKLGPQERTPCGAAPVDAPARAHPGCRARGRRLSAGVRVAPPTTSPDGPRSCRCAWARCGSTLTFWTLSRIPR